jgi:aquaglyceroporin related protein
MLTQGDLTDPYGHLLSQAPSLSSTITMVLDKESTSSTPPVTHSEGLLQPHHHEYRHSTVDGQPAFAEHGALVDHKVPNEDLVQSEPDLLWSRIRHVCREPFSEFFGVFILILFGDGVVAQVVLSNGEKGDYQSISWGWG